MLPLRMAEEAPVLAPDHAALLSARVSEWLALCHRERRRHETAFETSKRLIASVLLSQTDDTSTIASTLHLDRDGTVRRETYRVAVTRLRTEFR